MTQHPASGALVTAKWAEGRFQTRDGFVGIPVRLKTSWALSSRGLRHRIVRAVAVWSEGNVVYGGEWLCGEWSGQITLLADGDVSGRVCERCELRDRHPARPVVYRAFTATDDLLYIGSTGDLGSRLYAHKCRSAWWAEHTRVTVEEHRSLNAARAAESAAIAAERPVHNVQGLQAVRS